MGTHYSQKDRKDELNDPMAGTFRVKGCRPGLVGGRVEGGVVAEEEAGRRWEVNGWWSRGVKGAGRWKAKVVGVTAVVRGGVKEGSWSLGRPRSLVSRQWSMVV